jgi:chromosome partitioning protein
LILAVANQKGGVGKTTTSVNLAASLALLGQETLLIDMDPQANASSGLGITRDRAPRHIYHALLGEATLDEVSLNTSVERLTIVPSHLDLYGAEVELVNAENREVRLRDALKKLKKNYNFIIIDCPPSLGLLTLNGLVAAGSLLIPMPCEYYALEGLSLLMNTMDRLKEGLNPRLELEGVLVTMYDGRSNLSHQVLQEIKKFFGDKVLNTTIPRNVRLAEAPGFGVPVVQHDKASTGAVAYGNLAQEILLKRGISWTPPAAPVVDITVKTPEQPGADAPVVETSEKEDSVVMSSANGGSAAPDEEGGGHEGGTHP